MVERVKVLRERLYRLYRGREKLRKAFVEGSLTLDEYKRRKRSLESEIAVDEHKLVKILGEDRDDLHQHLKELNSKHRSGEIDGRLYNKAYRRLSHRINRVELYLSEVDDGKGLYSYLGYGKKERGYSRKQVIVNAVILFLFLVTAASVFKVVLDSFYVDSRAVIEELNLSGEGVVEYGNVSWSLSFESHKKKCLRGQGAACFEIQRQQSAFADPRCAGHIRGLR
ncbi:MAG: hypothetical protein U9M95_01945 [Candidatus Altiarchaeota archaeon]|nr:hypothetical protein [Candidatus Altiarchaeota archaeon]